MYGPTTETFFKEIFSSLRPETLDCAAIKFNNLLHGCFIDYFYMGYGKNSSNVSQCQCSMTCEVVVGIIFWLHFRRDWHLFETNTIFPWVNQFWTSGSALKRKQHTCIAPRVQCMVGNCRFWHIWGSYLLKQDNLTATVNSDCYPTEMLDNIS